MRAGDRPLFWYCGRRRQSYYSGLGVYPTCVNFTFCSFHSSNSSHPIISPFTIAMGSVISTKKMLRKTACIRYMLPLLSRKLKPPISYPTHSFPLFPRRRIKGKQQKEKSSRVTLPLPPSPPHQFTPPSQYPAPAHSNSPPSSTASPQTAPRPLQTRHSESVSCHHIVSTIPSINMTSPPPKKKKTHHCINPRCCLCRSLLRLR